MADPLERLSAEEATCVRRYVGILADVLGSDLSEVWLFGSAARGDMWSAMPIRSDIDLLVLTVRPPPEDVRSDLVVATYPLFLECGRQICPQFRTTEWFQRPPQRPDREFVGQVRHEGSVLYRAE